MPPPFDVEDLRRRLGAGERFSCRHFYDHTPRGDGELSNAVFSQFYARPFAIEGETYLWATQWMMACKARLFHDGASLARIMAAQSPADCEAIGRGVANYDDARWSAVRFDLVLAGTVAKFGQNDALMDYLLATGDEVLVEAAPHDPVWGIGLSRDDPGAGDPMAWRGLNLLGFALMWARSHLREQPPAP